MAHARLVRARRILPLAVAATLIGLAITSTSGADTAPPAGGAAGSPPDVFRGDLARVASRAIADDSPVATTRTASALTAEGHFGPAVASLGRTAKLRGTITREGRPDPSARLQIGAGANRGVEMSCDSEGRFASVGLYPGHGLLVVRSGNECVTRELDLAPSEAGVCDLDFSVVPPITGRVVAADGEPIAGASVSADGELTSTDATGGFTLIGHASGEALLLVERSGYVPYRSSLRLDRRTTPLEIELARSGQLTISLASLPGNDDGSDAEIYLVPLVPTIGKGDHRPSLPPQEHCPLRVPAGGSRTVEGLPATRFDVVAFHRTAKSKPATVWVQTDRPCSVRLEWESVPSLGCTVTRAGLPLAGVSVSLVVADPYRTTMRHLGAARRSWRDQPMQLLPGVAACCGRTDREGSCTLPRWGDRLDPGCLVVTTGRTTITRPLTADDGQLVIEIDDPIAASTVSRDLRRIPRGSR